MAVIPIRNLVWTPTLAILFLTPLAHAQKAPATRPAADAAVAKPARPEKAADEWAFLDNGQIRLGVKKQWGAGIAWVSASGSQSNLVDHWDTGRLIQQSYYGDEDGSTWNKKPWRWNPVQGGEWRGTPSKILEFKADKTTLYAKILPRNWGGGEELPEVNFEQWVTLKEKVAHVRFKMTYTGQRSHAKRHHEIPAFFVPAEYSTLVLYDGDKPWTDAATSRSQPGWPNESRKMTENWAAYVNEKDYGIGAYVPAAKELTCYRYQGGKSSCSYFAPLTRFAITPGLTFEYDLYVTFGTAAQIRQAFAEVRKASAATAPAK